MDETLLLIGGAFANFFFQYQLFDYTKKGTPRYGDWRRKLVILYYSLSALVASYFAFVFFQTNTPLFLLCGLVAVLSLVTLSFFAEGRAEWDATSSHDWRHKLSHGVALLNMGLIILSTILKLSV
jgi:hypothetical protein